MTTLSTQQVARKLGIGMATLTRYIQARKVPAPKTTLVGGMRIRLWNGADIQQVREILPKIANGRKTRHKRKGSKAKKKTQPRAAALPNKKSKP